MIGHVRCAVLTRVCLKSSKVRGIIPKLPAFSFQPGIIDLETVSSAYAHRGAVFLMLRINNE